MSFGSQFEYEDELDREILGLPDEGEFEGLVLVPDSERVGDLFVQRISGFDWRMTTAPSVATYPPDRPVLKLQNAAVRRIIQEIRKRTATSCIRVIVTGFGGRTGSGPPECRPQQIARYSEGQGDWQADLGRLARATDRQSNNG